MIRETGVLLCVTILFTFPVLGGLSQTKPQAQRPANIALINGQWFNGKSFEARTVYSVNGRFTFKKPTRVDHTLDLAGTWIVPPFGDAHNHNIDGINEERARKAIQKFLADGVFYVKIQGNLPAPDEMRRRLSLNQPSSIDAVLAQGSLTTTGGIAEFFAEIMIRQNVYPGHTKETLKDYSYFTIDSEADLEKKWPLILNHHPDFIKTHLWFSDEYAKRKNDPAYFGQKGLDPQKLGVFDSLTLLKMWTETTAKTIFPQRKIGALREGYEASFLALEGNPLLDPQNVRKIKLRFKQGSLLESQSIKP